MFLISKNGKYLKIGNGTFLFIFLSRTKFPKSYSVTFRTFFLQFHNHLDDVQHCKINGRRKSNTLQGNISRNINKN